MFARPTKFPQGKQGFSLIELLAVVAIIAVMATLTTGAIKSFGVAYELDSSVQGVTGVLNNARQMALSQNKYVQVRFYEQTNNADLRWQNYFAIATYVSDSPFYPTNAGTSASDYQTQMDRGRMKVAGATYFLPSSIGIIKSANNSALLNSLSQDQVVRTGSDTTGKMKGYPWVSFYFNPQGSIDVPYVDVGTNKAPLASTRSYFSLCEMKKLKSDTLPPNYATILFDPANGRVQVTRP